MVKGAFAYFTHDHYLSEIKTGTLMNDRFEFASPFWPLGTIVDGLFLAKYMTGLLEKRNEVIKNAAESDDWRQFLN
ncbi:MAG: cell division protein, partial [Acidobacteriota bacterium]